MPNIKKGHASKYGNSMVPVKVVPIFLRCQKQAAKLTQHKPATKCVTLPQQKRISLFALTTVCNYVCFRVE